MTRPATPFVIGVLADLTLQPGSPLQKLKDRRFVTITRQSLPTLMRHCRPRKLVGTDFPIQELTFETQGDFDRDSLAERIAKQGKKDEEALRLAESIMLDPGVHNLYATWTGLSYLTDSVAGNPGVRIKVLNVSKREIFKDLQRASEFDQSALFRHINDREFATFGGEPFGCLVVDCPFSTHPEDGELLQGLSRIASASSVPLLIGLDPQFFYLKNWADLNPDVRLDWLRGASLYAKWRTFQESPESQFVFALMNRFAVQSTATPGGSCPCNPVYLVSAMAAQSFRETDLQAIGENLYPPDPSEPSNAISFEWDCPKTLAEKLTGCGFNPLKPELLRGRRLLQSVVSLHADDAERPAINLAEALFLCAVNVRLRAELRIQTNSGSIGKFEELVDDALTCHGLKDPVTRGPLRFERSDHSLRPAGLVLTFTSSPEFFATEQPATSQLFLGSSHLFAGSVPKSSAIRFRVLVVTEILGSAAKPHVERSFQVTKDQVDRIFSRQPEIDLGTPGASLKFRGFDDFDPERMVARLGPIKPLAQEKMRLLNLAAYANLSSARSALVWNRGVPRDLLQKIDDWRRVIAAGPPFPPDLERIEQSVPGGISAWTLGPDGVDWARTFQEYEERLRDSPNSTEDPGTAGIPIILEHLDWVISAGLLRIYGDEAFRRLAATSCAIRRLVESPPNQDLEVTLLPVDRDHVWADVEFWLQARDADPDDCLRIVVIDFQDSEAESDIAALLESIGGRRVIVLYACDTAAESVTSSPRANKLLLVRPDFAVQRYPPLSGRSLFPPIRNLRGNAVYLVAEALVNIGDTALEMDSDGLQTLQKFLEPFAFRCDRAGNATLISLHDR
jgi:predicted component of type VI protein secretion system